MGKFTVYSHAELVEKLEIAQSEIIKLKSKINSLEHELRIFRKAEDNLISIDELNKRLNIIMAVRDI